MYTIIIEKSLQYIKLGRDKINELYLYTYIMLETHGEIKILHIKGHK